MPVKIVIPENVFDLAKLKRAIKNGFRASGEAARADFGVVTQTWSSKSRPTFKLKVYDDRATVSTDQYPFIWVDEGTKGPYIIRPKNSKRLVFSPGGKAKTSPGKIRSIKGGRGKGKVFALQVVHPGIKPRGFTEVIQETWQDKFPETMQRSIDAEIT